MKKYMGEIIIVIFLIICLCLMACGCFYSGALHREYVNGQLVRQDEIGIMYCLYTSKQKELTIYLDNIADMSIGSSIRFIDPNVVEAVTEGVVKGLVGAGGL